MAETTPLLHPSDPKAQSVNASDMPSSGDDEGASVWQTGVNMLNELGKINGSCCCSTSMQCLLSSHYLNSVVSPLLQKEQASWDCLTLSSSAAGLQLGASHWSVRWLASPATYWRCACTSPGQREMVALVRSVMDVASVIRMSVSVAILLARESCREMTRLAATIS